MCKLLQRMATSPSSQQKQVPAEQGPNAIENLLAGKKPRPSGQPQQAGRRGRTAYATAVRYPCQTYGYRSSSGPGKQREELENRLEILECLREGRCHSTRQEKPYLTDRKTEAGAQRLAQNHLGSYR